MKPIKTRYTNRILGAPDGWNVLRYSPCVGLPLIQTKTGPGDGEVQYHSTWKTTWRERFLILLGCPVTLGVNGVFHPPVSISVAFRNDKPAEPWNPEHDVEDDKTPIKAVS
jgi:hypothetical protein